MARIDNVITERQVKGGDTLPTYVSVTKFNIPKVGVRVEIRHNKDDEYEPFDNIKKGLLKVIKDWLDEGNKIDMGRYEFANLILDMYTKAVSECEGDAYRVEYFEASDQVGKYIDKNKKKIETLERVKNENAELDKKIKNELNKKKFELEPTIKKVEEKEKEKEKEEIVEEIVEVEEKPKRGRSKKVVEKEEVKSGSKRKVVKPLDILPTSSRREGMNLR